MLSHETLSRRKLSRDIHSQRCREHPDIAQFWLIDVSAIVTSDGGILEGSRILVDLAQVRRARSVRNKHQGFAYLCNNITYDGDPLLLKIDVNVSIILEVFQLDIWYDMNPS